MCVPANAGHKVIICYIVPLIDFKEALLAHQMASKEVVVYGMRETGGIEGVKMLSDCKADVSHQTNAGWYVG